MLIMSISYSITTVQTIYERFKLEEVYYEKLEESSCSPDPTSSPPFRKLVKPKFIVGSSTQVNSSKFHNILE